MGGNRPLVAPPRRYRLDGGTDDRAVLVDSTRRGKRVPDALSKTVPIWCAVINRAVSQQKRKKVEVREGEGWREVWFPEESVSAQEVAAIRMLIPSFVRSFQVPALVLSLMLIHVGLRSRY